MKSIGEVGYGKNCDRQTSLNILYFMGKKKVAIFVDWENVRKGIFEKASNTLHKKIDYNNVNNVLKFFDSFIEPDEEEIYRTFVYLSEPYAGIADGKDYKTTPVFTNVNKFYRKASS